MNCQYCQSFIDTEDQETVIDVDKLGRYVRFCDTDCYTNFMYNKGRKNDRESRNERRRAKHAWDDGE